MGVLERRGRGRRRRRGRRRLMVHVTGWRMELFPRRSCG